MNQAAQASTKKRTTTKRAASKPTVSAVARAPEPPKRRDGSPSRQRERHEARVKEARSIHDEWLDGFNPDRLSDAAHAMRVLTLLGLEPNYYIEGTQLRVQVGLDALDVVELAFSSKLITRLEKSRDEVAEKTLDNAAEAEKARLKAKQRRR
jgi:hypothetical protein